MSKSGSLIAAVLAGSLGGAGLFTLVMMSHMQEGLTTILIGSTGRALQVPADFVFGTEGPAVAEWRLCGLLTIAAVTFFVLANRTSKLDPRKFKAAGRTRPYRIAAGVFTLSALMVLFKRMLDL
ncbi:hypothetical protein EP7_001298 [Isosphaeraceae bacterium EP7]